jgi:uncharacterized membrane-anchored protein YhcB (DUF1043 family)
MEGAMTASIFGLITFILGIFAGFGIYHYFFKLSNQERKLLEELEHLKADFKGYHDQVAKNLTESAALTDELQTISLRLHDHILNASVALNRSAHKQSILQPVLHAEPHHDHDDEQVTEFHPIHIETKTKITPPKDYV